MVSAQFITDRTSNILISPWANGTLVALHLKGLDSFIGYSVTHYTWQRTRPNDENDKHCGWVFRE